MNIGKARALFEQVASGEYHGSTVGEYLEAVKIVLDMETHNSISKKMIISVCKWLVEIAEKAVSPYRWIPCSERMPEEHEWIGTKKFGTTISDEVYVTFENEKGERFCRHMKFQNGELSRYDQFHMDTWFKGSKPIAWMPLPEPYKPNKKQSGKEGA